MSDLRFEGVGETLFLSSNTTHAPGSCQHCRRNVDENQFNREPMENMINHLIEQHGYRLLHVGQETSHDGDGRPWQSTVAVLGK